MCAVVAAGLVRGGAWRTWRWADIGILLYAFRYIFHFSLHSKVRGGRAVARSTVPMRWGQALAPPPHSPTTKMPMCVHPPSLPVPLRQPAH